MRQKRRCGIELLRVEQSQQLRNAVAKLLDGAVVGSVVSRFINNAGDSRAFALRVVSLDEPDWRVRAYPLLKPLQVQTQGIQAWLLEREQAAILMAEISKRTDFLPSKARPGKVKE